MQHLDQVLEIVKEFAGQLGFPGDLTITGQYDKEADLYQILIETQTPGPIIGFHGETLSSLQLLVGQHLHAKIGEWLNLSINVNDYRQRRETSLKSLADSAVNQVLSTNTPHQLPPMPSSERRIIHLYLSENPNVATESVGLGKNRYLVISPKNPA